MSRLPMLRAVVLLVAVAALVSSAHARAQQVGVAAGGQWQVNQAAASFELDLTYGSPYACAEVIHVADNSCSFGETTVTFASVNIGAPWDLAITSGPAVPNTGPGFVTGGGQSVNVDLSDPTLAFLNGLTFTTLFFADFSVVFAPGAPFDAAAQMAVIDGAQFDGFVLSQATNLHVVLPAVGFTSGPTGDDEVLSYPIGTITGVCAFNFYGQSFTQLNVTTNGRVEFGTPDASYSPSINGAASDPGMIGAWSDLDQSSGGYIVLFSPAPSVLRIDWVSVPYFFAYGNPLVSFQIELDQSSGRIVIYGLNTIGFNPYEQQFLGISPGAGATDPGSFAFTPGPFTTGPGGSNMIYAYGTAGSLAQGGAAAVFFTVNGSNYDVQVY